MLPERPVVTYSKEIKLTNFINVGALTSDARRVSTKKQLKELCESGEVAFDQTGFPLSGLLPGTIVPEDMKSGIILSVVGPDPHAKRNWYANVELKGGKLVVR